jgi:hypothetical protein
MPGHRKLIRDAVRLAISADARFSGNATAKRAWVQNVDAAGLPAFTVTTARELVTAASKDDLRRQIDLGILLQRQGGDDLEDIADLDAAAIEALVPGVVEAISGVLDVVIAVTDFRLAGPDAGKRVSSLDMRFAVTVLTNRPA